jgi:hypothetical protein
MNELQGAQQGMSGLEVKRGEELCVCGYRRVLELLQAYTHTWLRR